MSWLYGLEKLRLAAPWLAAVFSYVTYLGGEALLFAIGLYVLWCVNKREGFYILSVGFLGTIVNQALKITFRIPRPWVKDPDFTIWEGARAEATGYSFPSGHSQNVTGTLGGLAIWHRKSRVALTVFPILIALVLFSRMFLGVHTPLDVFVGFGSALLLLSLFYPFFRVERSNRAYLSLFAGICFAVVLYLLYVLLYHFPADTDPANLTEARKNGWSMLGCVLGLLLFLVIEQRYIRYETEATLPGQIVKFICGVILVLGVKEGLKPLFRLLFGAALFPNAIRYFLAVAVAGLIWPLAFPYLSKIGKKDPGKGPDPDMQTENQSSKGE